MLPSTSISALRAATGRKLWTRGTSAKRFAPQQRLGAVAELAHDVARAVDAAHCIHRMAGVERHRLDVAARLAARAVHGEARDRDLLSGHVELTRDVVPKRVRGFDRRAQHAVG